MGEHYDTKAGCELCGEIIKLEAECIALRVGCFKQSPKHGGWYFQPESFDDEEEIKWFHLDCLGDYFDLSEAEEPPQKRCSKCGMDLNDEVWFCEIELARWDVHRGLGYTHEPVRDPDGQAARAFYCWDCVYDNLEDSKNVVEILGMNVDEPAPQTSTPFQRSKLARYGG